MKLGTNTEGGLNCMTWGIFALLVVGCATVAPPEHPLVSDRSPSRLPQVRVLPPVEIDPAFVVTPPVVDPAAESSLLYAHRPPLPSPWWGEGYPLIATSRDLYEVEEGARVVVELSGLGWIFEGTTARGTRLVAEG